MKIAFAPEVMNDRQWFPILDAILLVIEGGNHVFSPDTLSELLVSGWVAARGIGTRDFIRLSSTSSSTDALAHRNCVMIDQTARRGGAPGQDGRTTLVHPLDAIVFLSTPFQVIVENELFDGGFILWMAKAFGFLRLVEAYHNHKFVFRNAGGKDFIVRSATAVSQGIWPRPDRSTDRGFKHWLCVVFDNDAKDSTHDPNKHIRENAEYHVLFVHQLQRRSIESYLSEHHLLRFDPSPAFRRKVGALSRLSDQQRTHFHMKRGFRFQKDVEPTKVAFLASNDVTQGQKDLYRAVTDPDWLLLMGGFGRGLSEIFVDPKYRPNSNDQNLTSAADKAELLNLFRSIYESI